MKLIEKIVFEDGEELNIKKSNHVILFQDGEISENGEINLTFGYNVTSFDNLKNFSDILTRLALTFKNMHKHEMVFPIAQEKAIAEIERYRKLNKK